MPIVSANVHLDVKQTGYLAAHVGWLEPALSVIVAISRPESDGNSGTYRPESQNPKGGRDIGLVEINDKAWEKPDPFTRFHPIINLADALTIWRTAAFVPWGYPSKRNDTTLGVAAIRAELGATPYAIDRSPYWLLHDRGIDTMDLPIPPADHYVSRLPAPPLKYGDSPSRGPTYGPRINALQRILVEMGLFTGTVDQYYGPRVRAGVTEIQHMLGGLYVGPYDGQYSTATHGAWDDSWRFNYLAGGR